MNMVTFNTIGRIIYSQVSVIKGMIMVYKYRLIRRHRRRYIVYKRMMMKLRNLLKKKLIRFLMEHLTTLSSSRKQTARRN